jgi:hypothetical protein
VRGVQRAILAHLVLPVLWVSPALLVVLGVRVLAELQAPPAL